MGPDANWLKSKTQLQESVCVCSAALLLLSHFSCVQLCVIPEMAAHQAPRPWDSPGKNTGVGCHCLLQCMKVKSENEVAQSCPTLHDPMNCSPPCSSVLGIFQAGVLEWGAIAFSSSTAQLCPTLCNHIAYSLPGSSVSGVFQARILEWAAISSSRGSSQPSDWTSISCTGRQFLYHWATSESVEQQEFSFIAGRNAKLYSHSGRPHDSFLWN